MSDHVCTCGDCAIDVFVDHCKFEAALVDLVALKDGPRDAEYERRKPLAWQAARDALGVPAPAPPDISQMKLGPFVRDSETSRQAALAAYPKQGTQRARVLRFVYDRAARGCTRDEIAAGTGLSPNTVRPRVKELMSGNWLREMRDHRGGVLTRPSAAGHASELLTTTHAARMLIIAEEAGG